MDMNMCKCGNIFEQEESCNAKLKHILELIVIPQVRGRRQLASGLSTTIEGDIVVRDSSLGGDQTSLDAHLADPDRLWPSGVVEYRFYDTFPGTSKQIVLRAMEYITSKVSCITFREATELADNYVLIQDGLHCNSELGRTGGVQKLNLNR